MAMTTMKMLTKQDLHISIGRAHCLSFFYTLKHFITDDMYNKVVLSSASRRRIILVTGAKQKNFNRIKTVYYSNYLFDLPLSCEICLYFLMK